MNKIILLGRLTADTEIKYTQNEKCVAQFTLAVNRPFTGADGKSEADFINIVAWNKTAELIGNYVHKGQRLLVEGRLQIRAYDAKDGSKRYVTEVIASNIEFIEKKEGGSPATASNDGFSDMGATHPLTKKSRFKR